MLSSGGGCHGFEVYLTLAGQHSGFCAEFDEEVANAATLAGCGTGRELGAQATIS
jgi:hypothetical protein